MHTLGNSKNPIVEILFQQTVIGQVFAESSCWPGSLLYVGNTMVTQSQSLPSKEQLEEGQLHPPSEVPNWKYTP